MFSKNTKLILIFSFLVTSCSDTWDSVKRGLTNKKQKSADEFLVKKKDPLTLPPDFEQLPSPDDDAVAENVTNIKSLLKTDADEIGSESTGSAEQSILEKIRRK